MGRTESMRISSTKRLTQMQGQTRTEKSLRIRKNGGRNRMLHKQDMESHYARLWNGSPIGLNEAVQLIRSG